jgi:hypothetical protein
MGLGWSPHSLQVSKKLKNSLSEFRNKEIFLKNSTQKYL